MRPGNPRDFLIVLAWSLASIAVALGIWLGPLAYAVGRLGDGGSTADVLVVTLASGWAIALARDGQLVGLLVGGVHSILIFARIVKDPWEGER